MIATIQNISSSKFSLNGLEYNKSFIALKVGDNYIRIVSVYDTRLELVATTHFNQVQVGGTVHTSANNLINALTDVLFSKAESSGGGLEPGGDFTGTLNVGTGATTKYNDYISGSAVSLALSSSKIPGSYATVRIKGSLTGSWPSTWKVSGDAKSTSADHFNELSIAYFADNDIRGVNRVYSISGAPTGDSTAPSVPSGLTSPAKTDTTVDLSWTASTDNVGVTGYVIYKNGVYEKEVGGTTAQVTGLSASTSYNFSVSAIDAAGNESAKTSAISVTTSAAASYSADSTAVFGRMATQPPTTYKNAMNTFINSLVTAGLWSKIDELQCPALDTSANGLRGWKGLVDATLGNGAVNTPKLGVAYDKAAGHYTNTGFIPSTLGTNYAQYSAWAAHYVVTGTYPAGESDCLGGVYGTGANMKTSLAYNKVDGNLNNQVSDPSYNVDTTRSEFPANTLIISGRNTASKQFLYGGATLYKETASTASVVKPDKAYAEGCLNNNGSFMNHIEATVFLRIFGGGDLTAQNLTDLNNAVQAFKTAITSIA